ncbi:MAG: alkaline phosphatase family protein [Planctomycetes bacterium]|nr:alkaline phosphatase family protein [Planctomycetota bacterium]
MLKAALISRVRQAQPVQLSYFGVIALCAIIPVAPLSGRAADFVIHVSVDGLHPGHLQTQINAGLAPHFKRFQDEGAWTNNARTDYSHTITLPNHTSMITGRPVCSPTEAACNPVGAAHTFHHGYTSNSDPPVTWTLHNQGNLNIPYKASTFDVAHDAGLSTALYASKNKFIIYEQSYNAAAGWPHANGADKIDTFANPESSLTMQTSLLSALAASDFEYTFVHYADPDDAGHTYGWGSPTYMTSIVTVNNYLGQLFSLVEDDPELAGRTAIVLSADHGGTGTNHSTATNAANYTIPFFVWGAGVAHGDLYALNQGARLDPGTGRPDFNAAGQPIRNGDGGNLALALLGLSAIPGSSINSSQNLRVAFSGDFNLDNVIDAADYVIWRKGVSVTPTPDQYNIWRTNFGRSAGGGSGSAGASPSRAAPEPAGGLMLLGLAPALLLRPRRRLLECTLELQAVGA